MYKEAVQLQSVATALHTLYAAVKYQCGGLVKMCVLYLDSKLDSSSVLEVYRDLRMYCNSTLSPQITIQDDHSSSQQPSLSPSATVMEHPFHRDHIPTVTDGYSYFLPTNSEAITDALLYCNALQHNCMQYIDLHTKEVLEQEELEDLDHEGLRLIALRETLTVPSESVLFDALVRWCNCECKRRRLELSAENKRAVLGEDTLYAVRYILMSSEEFLAGPLQSGLLNPSEISEFLGYILHHPVPENPRPAIRQMQTPRSGPRSRPVPLSQRSNLEISDKAMAQALGSQSGSTRLWGGKKYGKRDTKKQKKEKSKSSSPERDGLGREKRSFCSRFVEYFFSALSCLFD